MTLGVSAYELSQFIKRLKLTGLSKTLLTIVKWLSFISVIVFAYFHFNRIYNIVPIILIFMLLVLSFSENTYNITYNPATKFLGKLGLPLYLTHSIIKK